MGPGNGSWLVDSKILGQWTNCLTRWRNLKSSVVWIGKILGLENGLWLVDVRFPATGHTSHTHVIVMSNYLHRTCVNRYNILGPSKRVHDWWNERFGPVEKINVRRMWIGWIRLGLENNGLWLVEHSFSASGENRIHTHTHTHTDVTKKWPAVWIGACFFGPCVIGPLWLFWATGRPKRTSSEDQKFDWRFFSVSTVSLRILDIRICTVPLIFLDFVVFPDLPFQCKSTQTTSLLRWASSRATLVLFFRRRRRSCRVLVSTFSRSLVVRCDRRRRRGNKKLLNNFENKEKRQETSEEF
jgi:hypothetical protein